MKTIQKTMYYCQRLFILNAFLLTSFLKAEPPDLQFKHLNLLDGLSQSHVICIARDTLGFMWFGTEDGLNRFDGYQFKIFRHNPDDTTSISGNYISTMKLDSKGRLWIGTEGSGLNRYNQEKNCFVHYSMTDDENLIDDFSYVKNIIEDHNGDLWIGYDTGGLVHFSPDNGKYIQYKGNMTGQNTISYDDIWSVCEDHNHQIWIGTMGGGVTRFNRETKTFTSYLHQPDNPGSLANNEIWTIYEDKRQTLWIGTYGSGLDRYDPDSDSFIHYTHDSQRSGTIGDNVIFVMLEDKEGNFWVGTENGGLNLFDRDTGEFFSYQENPNNPYSLSHNSVECLLIDDMSTLWLGTYNGGVNYYSPYLRKFQHFRKTEGQNSLSNNIVLCFFQDSQGKIWIGTDGGGLNLFDKKNGHFEHFVHDPADPKSISGNSVLSIYEDHRGNFWVGTFQGGLNRMNRRTGQFEHWKHDPKNSSTLTDNDIRTIFEDSHDELWIGTGGGLNKFNREKGAFKRYYTDEIDTTTISHSSIYSIFEDSNENLWFGTYSHGLNRYNRKQDCFKRYFNNPNDNTSLSNNFIFSIFEDSQKRLWIGTAGGLNRYHNSSDTFTQLRIPNSMPNDVINGILEDSEGYLWLSTNNGLSRIHPDMRKVHNYTILDGLQSNEFRSNSCLKTREGDYYFGGVNGFNIFRVEDIIENPYPPPVRLTEFTIFNQPVTFKDDSPLQESITLAKTLTLSYKYNVIGFEFTALNYILPQKNQYKYRLEGFEDQWNTQYRRTVTYTNLDPGEYTLRVIASNNDNVWNEKGVSLKIKITPPLWGYLWFKITFAMILIGCIAFIYLQKMKAIKQHTLELETYNRNLNKQIDARKTAEKKLSKLNAELESRVKKRTAQLENAILELESFSYTVSHDLRAPLRSIDGFSNILQESMGNRLKENEKEAMDHIHRSIKRMACLIDDLLNLARISRKHIQVETIDLTTLVLQIFNEQLRMRSKNDIKPEIVVQSNLQVSADSQLLQTALENLISNALKYSSKSEKPRIEFGVLPPKETEKEGLDGMQIFYIKDNGVGFDMAYMDKLFNPFQRLHGSDEFEGTGIGLAIVQRIIHQHDGEVWAEGELDKGATFYFSL